MEFYCEAAFSIANEKGISIADDLDSDSAADFLAHAVARAPADLRRHVQRIRLHLKYSNSQALTAALIDLFIGLGSKGRPLRERLLESSAPLLDVGTLTFLHSHLRSGLQANDVILDAADAMLSKGIGSEVIAITEIAADSGQQRDYLAEAQSYIEYGQLELAKTAFEQGILLQPQLEQLHHELLEFYQYTDDKDAFHATLQQLTKLGNPFAELWREEIVFTKRGFRGA